MNARDYQRLPDQRWYLRHPEHRVSHSYAAVNRRPPRPNNGDTIHKVASILKKGR